MPLSTSLVLRSDLHAHAAVDRLCVVGRCARRRETTAVVRLGGRDREIAVCSTHSHRFGGPA